MKCEFCNFEFNEEDAKKGCRGCAMSKSCCKIKCPNCNYEMYPDVNLKLFKTMKEWGTKAWKK